MFDEIAFEKAVQTAADIRQETGFLPPVDEVRLCANEIAYWNPWDPVEQMVPPHDKRDPAHRAVVGAVLHYIVWSASEARESDNEARRELREFASSVPVHTLSDVGLLRWELHLATAAEDLDRVLALGRRLEDLSADADHLALTARAGFILLNPGNPNPSKLSWPDPSIRAQWTLPDISDLLTYAAATVVGKRPDILWVDPAEWSLTQRSALLVMQSLLDRVAISARGLDATEHAIRTWINFATGAAVGDLAKLEAAGDAYTSLPPHPIADRDKTCRLAMRAAVECFSRARKWRKAAEAARNWVKVDESNAEAFRQLAEALYRDQRIPESIEAFEQYVRHRNDDDDDWEASLLLKLGLESATADKIAGALQSAAMATPFRQHGEALTLWHSGWFGALSPKARERWWTGLYAVSSPHLASDWGHARWDHAADSFGEAVAFELRERVFKPFALVAPLPGGDEYWRKVLTGRGTLGDMLNCLLVTQRGTHPLAVSLREWLFEHLPAFWRFVKDAHVQQFQPLWALRAKAQHDSVTETEARRVYELASQFLRVLSCDAARTGA
jgi:tetratricopeptide (TPR) repeat protein